MADTATITRQAYSREGDELPPHRERTPPRSPAEQSRRRFTIAVIVGTAIILPALLWIMWDLWSGSLNVLRSVPYDYFYDLQARAMFHGHLYLPNGKMGIEAFVHNGRDYTYFGIFPSLIRMPILRRAWRLVRNCCTWRITISRVPCGSTMSSQHSVFRGLIRAPSAKKARPRR